jgi:hypothetical protein
MDTDYQKQALQYKPKGQRNIGRPRKRRRDQLHLDDQGTGNMPNPSGTWWWWWRWWWGQEMRSHALFLWNFELVPKCSWDLQSHDLLCSIGCLSKMFSGSTLVIPTLWDKTDVLSEITSNKPTCARQCRRAKINNLHWIQHVSSCRLHVLNLHT